MKGKKLGFKSKIWNRKRNKHSTRQNEETRIQNNEERLKNHPDNFKCSNFQIIGQNKRKSKKL